MPDLTFRFDNEETLQHFKLWLCEAGEQDYWTWMECREGEEDGDITAVDFNYHTAEGVRDGDNFDRSNVIIAKSGRLDR